MKDFSNTPLEELYERMMLVSIIIKEESREGVHANLTAVLAGMLEIHELKEEIASKTLITFKELDYLCLS